MEYNFNNGENNENNIIDAFETSQNTFTSKRKAKKHPFAKKVGVLVLSGTLFGVAAGGAYAGSTYLFPQNTVSTTQKTNSAATATLTTTTSNASSLATSTSSSSSSTMTVADIAESCMSSIVAITNIGVTEVNTMWGMFEQESESCGSGVIIGKTDSELLIVTNYHVIEGNSTLTVVFSYDEDSEEPSAVEAYAKGYDEDKDLAVIAISTDNLTEEMTSQLSIATIGSSDELTLGEQVVAIGNALGYGQSVTTGIVSALNRSISTDSTDSEANRYIQTDAAINPGNSGGALFNMNGELIGINSAKIADDEVEGMGYAIPISDVYELIQDLMNQTARTTVVDTENRGYLGISGTDVSSSVSEVYGIPEGVYVSSVTEGSAADVAGLEKGYVITKFDGKSVSTISELQTLLTYYAAGETVTMTVQVPEGSSYTETEIEVTLSSATEAGIESSTTTQDNASEDSSNGYSNGYNNGYSNGYSDGSSSNQYGNSQYGNSYGFGGLFN